MSGDLVPEYSIRHMRKEEIPAVLDLWRETCLSEGTYSLDTWFEYDPEGFYVAATDDGEILGVCAGILQHDDFAFIGMYVVKSIYRKKGIGIRIWQAVMDRIGDKNAGVNPVPNQLSNYRDRAGFPIQTSWYSVVCFGLPASINGFVQEIPGIIVRELCPNDPILEEVIKYDDRVNGFPRRNLVPLMTIQEDSFTAVALTEDGHTVCGYGNIKGNIKGNALVGPLYADNSSIAELLLHYLSEHYSLAKTKGLTLMILDKNEEAVSLVKKFGFKMNAGIARLYRREEVEADFSKIFGQHNLNFSAF